VHEEEINVTKVVDEEGLVAGWRQMAGFLVGAISNLWHSSLTLEPSANTIINTLWLSPTGVDTFETIALMAIEPFPVLLDDRNVFLCRNHFDSCSKRDWPAR